MAAEKKKNYTLSEALGYLDNLEVSSSNESESEDYHKLKSEQIFIQPPVNCNDMNSDIDKETKTQLMEMDVLSGNQLLARAALEMKLINAKVVIGNDDEKQKK